MPYTHRRVSSQKRVDTEVSSLDRENPLSLIIAHRGGRSLGQENTLLAIRQSLQLEIHGIEVDVRMSRDGIPILFHDPLIQYPGEILRERKRGVEELTLEELRQIHPHLTTLEECLDFLNKNAGERIRLFLEIKEGSRKYPGIEEKVIGHLKDYHWLERTFFLSFWRDVLGKIHSSLPNGRCVKLFYSVKRGIPLYKDYRVSIGYPFRGLPPFLVGVGIHWGSIKPWVIRECKKRNLKVYVWTVNDRRIGDEMRGFKVEGLITDDPRIFL